jgi:hypothetical protein
MQPLDIVLRRAVWFTWYTWKDMVGPRKGGGGRVRGCGAKLRGRFVAPEGWYKFNRSLQTIPWTSHFEVYLCSDCIRHCIMKGFFVFSNMHLPPRRPLTPSPPPHSTEPTHRHQQLPVDAHSTPLTFALFLKSKNNTCYMSSENTCHHYVNCWL